MKRSGITFNECVISWSIYIKVRAEINPRGLGYLSAN